MFANNSVHVQGRDSSIQKCQNYGIFYKVLPPLWKRNLHTHSPIHKLKKSFVSGDLENDPSCLLNSLSKSPYFILMASLIEYKRTKCEVYNISKTKKV